MKYGQTFQALSAPQWAPYNVDYNELKNLIKVNTTKDQGTAIAIPGQVDPALARFEEQFFNELANQHDRVDLFVKSKADEIDRRLQFLHKAVYRLLARCTFNNGKQVSRKRQDRFRKYDTQIERCGEDTKALQRFVDAQREAFRKILKKYRKWTGSKTLGEKFNREILGDPKSFTKRDFQPLLTEYSELLATLRAASPDVSEVSTPKDSSRRPSVQLRPEAAPQRYWNEYDEGSEAENEPYTIYVDPDAENSFLGSKAFAYVFSRAGKGPVSTMRRWFSPHGSPGERQPLNGHANGSYFPESHTNDTDVDDDAYASSTDFPTGYSAHYATFPSVNEQKISRYREVLLLQATFGSFAASLVLLIIAGILVATGRHHLRIEVDAGVIVGVVSSLFFAALGFGMMLYRKDSLGWLHQLVVTVFFATICIANGVLLVMVAGNT